jgi:hypothetical protein
MSEECKAECAAVEEAVNSKPNVKKKRDIFRFVGQEDMAIDLGHVYKIVRREKRIDFHIPVPAYEEKRPFADYIDFEKEESCKKAFEQIIAVWSADVLE